MLQIFGGIVNAGNLKLDGTDLSEDEYPLVFVEIFAFVLFFCCQWILVFLTDQLFTFQFQWLS